MPLNAAEVILARSMEPAIRMRPAIYFDGKVVSYTELHSLVNRAANTFLAMGVARGERVPLLLNDSPLYAACVLGLMKIGAVVIPLNTKLKPEEYRYIAADSGAKWLVHDAAFTEVLSEVNTTRLLAMRGSKDSFLRRMDTAPAQAAFAVMEEDEPCFWLYSSGTTGSPKGIIHSQRSAAQTSKLMREVLLIDETSVVFCTSKLFFAFAFDNALLGVIRTGAATVLNEGWADPETVIAQAQRYQPDALLTVPTFFRRLLQLPEEQLAVFKEIPLYATGGERVPDSVATKWKEVTGHDLLACHGMSETFCNTFANRQGEVRLGSCGKPLEGVEPMLLPREARPGELFASAEPIGVDEPGVLWLKHPALALRYNNEKKTAEAFEDGWFCTNDLFRVDADGYWFHEGRGDELLKIAGQWVKPQEVEDAVLGERVREAACVVVADADGFERLALYVVPAEEESVEAIEEMARAGLPSHSWPKWIRSVEELPRTPTGKVQKFRLRTMLRTELGLPVELEGLPEPEPPVSEEPAAEAKPKRKSRARAKPVADTTGELPLAEALLVEEGAEENVASGDGESEEALAGSVDEAAAATQADDVVADEAVLSGDADEGEVADAPAEAEAVGEDVESTLDEEPAVEVEPAVEMEAASEAEIEAQAGADIVAEVAAPEEASDEVSAAAEESDAPADAQASEGDPVEADVSIEAEVEAALEASAEADDIPQDETPASDTTPPADERQP